MVGGRNSIGHATYQYMQSSADPIKREIDAGAGGNGSQGLQRSRMNSGRHPRGKNAI